MTRDTLTPWLLRGGYRMVVLARTDTGEAVATTQANVLEATDTTGRRLMDDGTLRDDTRERSFLVGLHNYGDAAMVERWRADGAAVTMRLIAAGRGEHVVWDEPVPVLYERLPSARGALGGRGVLVHSGLFTPAIYDGPDLLSGLVFADAGDWTAAGTGTVTWGTDAGGAVTAALDEVGGTNPVSLSTTVVLPAPGLTVAFAVDAVADTDLSLTVEPLTFAGADAGGSATEPAVGTGVTDVVTTLPTGTYKVRVTVSGTGTVRLPELLTRKVSGSMIPAGQGAGVYGLKSRDNGDGSTTLVAYGPSSITDNGGGLYTIAAPDRAVGPKRAAGWIQTLNTDD